MREVCCRIAQQGLEQDLRILTRMGIEEVPDRRAGRVETMAAEDLRELVATPAVCRAPAGELLVVAEAGDRRRLGLCRDVERAAHLADGRHDLRRAYAVADAKAREPVDLRERPDDEHTPARLEVLFDCVRIVGLVDVFEVRLIDDGEDVLGNTLEVRIELVSHVHRSRRVVRIADVDELRARSHRGEQCGERVPIFDEGHFDRLGAELDCVDHVARKGRPAADDLVPRPQDRLREAVDDAVGARAHGDLLETDAVALGQGAAQPVGAAVGVAVQVARVAGHCFQRRRKRPVRPFVGGELDHSCETELALNLLDRHPGLVRDERRQRRPQEAVFRHSGLEPPDFLRQKRSAPPTEAAIVAIADLFSPA